MKATVESTAQIVEVNGIPARIWKGKTEKGVPFEMLVTRVAVPQSADQSQFEQELKETPAPHVSEVFSLRMIL